MNGRAKRQQLADMDPRDAAGVITERLGGAGSAAMVDAICERVERPHVSLLHQLLASLPVTEAVTTNYDSSFERAWCSAGRSPAVLPKAGTAGGEWLLKLHGSVDDRTRIVLSRSDYLRFEGEGTALAGVVHAMLLTRHLLFVGYSMRDDNFHRIVHQVRETVRGSTPSVDRRLGTVLTTEGPQLIHDVWKSDIDVCSTARGGGGENEVRRLAVLVDALVSETASPAHHLLDETYEAVFSTEELKLRDCIRAVQEAAAVKGVLRVSGRLWNRLRDRLGADWARTPRRRLAMPGGW